ncbi:MAG: 4Fe-4S binding protein [Candidatus Cloacimonetes bacterium]|nr:4Fe-4S binding protein [Candidatus Cloacimonadota bacterium]
MLRKIIEIDEEKCTGCGLCIPDCPEGALQIIDGKARLISDLFCDGLGACVGACPEDAMHVVEREAEPYNEEIVMENIIKAGVNTIKAHLQHLKEHGEHELFEEAVAVLKKKGLPIPELEEKEEKMACGCPGSHVREIKPHEEKERSAPVSTKSELRQWPVQLHLINPQAKYLDNADILLAADCTPFAYANFHQRFIKGKITITLCPKLDHGMEQYLEKLVTILKTHEIKSLTVVHMEVPCCSGIVHLAERAIRESGKNVLFRDYTISVDGQIL